MIEKTAWRSAPLALDTSPKEATGAIGIIIVSFKKKAYQPAALNVVWLVIAAIAIIKSL